MKILNVECYRLWENGHWDKVKVEISLAHSTIIPNDIELIESRAVQKLWMELNEDITAKKPLQIGLYMPSVCQV